MKLELKSVLYDVLTHHHCRYLCDDDPSQENLNFFQENGIQLFHVRMEGSKEPFVELDHSLMTRALTHVLGISTKAHG